MTAAAKNPLRERPYALPSLPAGRYYKELPEPESAGDTDLVFLEKSDPFESYAFRLERIVHQGETRYQDVLIADTYNYDRVLVLDGAVQSTEIDETIYHEMLVQPALLWHPEPRDVLVLGGGEGATLRETLAHRSVQRATMVDLDAEVVALCREHLPSWHRGAFDDPRTRLVIADGRAFVEGDGGRYDVVIVDIVDMLDNGPAQKLYTRQFYEQLRKRLRPNGVVVVQALEFSFLNDKPHAALYRTLQTVFSQVHSYRVHVPSFLGAWGFLVASDWLRPSDMSAESLDRAIHAKLGDRWLSHVTGDYVKAAFTHCRETRFLLDQPGPILEDGVDFVAPPFIENAVPRIALPGLR